MKYRQIRPGSLVCFQMNALIFNDPGLGDTVRSELFGHVVGSPVFAMIIAELPKRCGKKPCCIMMLDGRLGYVAKHDLQEVR